VIAEMAANGLVQGERGLEIYVMCEIPSNVILAAEFAAIFDGFSIGSNDLTQLVLGVDRDSELVAHLFDERNDAVRRMVAQVIAKPMPPGARSAFAGRRRAIILSSPGSWSPKGIDSLSLTPDSQLRTMVEIVDLERQLAAGGGVASEVRAES
jgi:pyruvate, water dikinase